jgi:hypothetical protein
MRLLAGGSMGEAGYWPQFELAVFRMAFVKKLSG